MLQWECTIAYDTTSSAACSENIGYQNIREKGETKTKMTSEKRTPAQLEQLKKLLGEDFAAFTEFDSARDKKQKQQKAKEIAGAMVAENGKYFEQYTRLEIQLNAVWDKAMAEANAQVGIVTEEKKE